MPGTLNFTIETGVVFSFSTLAVVFASASSPLVPPSLLPAGWQPAHNANPSKIENRFFIVESSLRISLPADITRSAAMSDKLGIIAVKVKSVWVNHDGF